MSDVGQLSGSTSLFDSLSFTTKKAEVKEEVEQPQEQVTQDTAVTEKPVTGKVPAEGVSFGDEEGPIIEADPETLQATGDDLPSLENNQTTQMADPNDLPNLFEDVALEDGKNTEKPEMNREHGLRKAIVHAELSFGTKTVLNMTEKVIANATTKSVTAALEPVLAKAIAGKAVARSSTTIGAKVAEGTAKGVEKAVANFTKAGLLGKGVETLTFREAALASGNVVRSIKDASKATSEILLKGGASKILPNASQAITKTSIGAGEKVLANGMKKGTTTAVEKLLEKAGAEASGKTISAAAAKKLSADVTKAVATGTAEAATKTSTKVAGKVAKAMPWVSAGVGTAIIAWDAHDAYKKTKDANVSTASKVLAWSTVGLDIVSTASTATGKGKALGWIATGGSIATGFLSDYLK